ncbi:HD family phosphohydrolase [Virgibacillus halodenitrificans]|uniref:HD family phosphohydrolase n=1 Tax=Virgibacillus halodenitrificans TaxID=1482 RepID=A0ABR7VMB9_VIRHA|nr:HD family phosphohydrolase [Virgibacillus halodenitrificans]MBD1222833.1 HD family phosphohydrolase [Virgibacillus halodenitrificans]
MEKKKKKSKLFYYMKNKWIFIILSVILLGIFFFFITLNNVHTETYNIERFTTTKETIRSPITIENEQETDRKRRETVQAVEDRYEISTEITEERIAYINEIFEAISKLEMESVKEDSDNKDIAPPLTNQEKVQQLKQLLSPEINQNINDWVFAELVEFPKEERSKANELLINSLQEVFEAGVRAENTQGATSTIKQSIKYSSLTPESKEALNKLAEFAVVENSFFDVEKTMNARKEAVSNVDPVTIRAGEVLVREGQVITNEIYEKLELAGLLDSKRNIIPMIGLGLLITLICSVIVYELQRINKHTHFDKSKIIATLLISVLVILFMKVVSLYSTQANSFFYVVPIATGALLIKQLIQERSAIIFSCLFAILGSIIFNNQIPGSLNIEAGIYFFFSQLAAIVFLMNVKDRLAILKAGVGITVINIITILLFLFLSFEKYAISDIFIQTSFGVISAFLSAVLTIGLLPFFETGLGILTDIKLLQLASPNQPLMKKLLTEAPGTYHHSVMVANLSETACEAIGANGLLARVGAYYHDLGKTLKPHYFIENQLAMSNPHDLITAKESAAIIIKHPYDGAAMLKRHRLPKEIIDIAEQHHGETLVKYFFYKELEKNKKAKEADFRYPGPKPQTREIAIISICDSVEAAVRSLKEPTEDKIEQIVTSIINDRMTDGQLDDSPLTLKELKVVQRTICTTLKGIFHSRIQYPMKEAK